MAFYFIGREVMLPGALYIRRRFWGLGGAIESILQQSPAQARDIRAKRSGRRRICCGSFQERQRRVICASARVRECSPVEQLAVAGAPFDCVSKGIARVPWRPTVEMLADRDD